MRVGTLLLMFTVLLVVVLVASSIYLNLISKGELVNIGMAVEFNDHSAAAWVALDKGWFKEEGLNVSKLVVFRTGLELATAMAKGDIPVAWVCTSPAILIYSRGTPIKILAMTHLHGYAIVARPEISDVRELSGKVVASSGPGSPTWLLLKMVIDMYNLSDVEIKKMPPFMSLNALLTGQIDAASLPEHYVSLAESKGMRVLIRSQDIWPNMPGSALVVREDFLKGHPDIVLKLIKVTVKSTKYINKNLNESARIVAKRLNVPYDVMLRSMKNLRYTYVIDKDEIQKLINLLVKYGVIN
ncbi:MAG: hypothetical protein DRO18_03570, partial [Thermoprotei archaeon]